jgi:hypothetical protein
MKCKMFYIGRLLVQAIVFTTSAWSISRPSSNTLDLNAGRFSLWLTWTGR